MLIPTLLALLSAPPAAPPEAERAALQAFAELDSFCNSAGLRLWNKSLCGPVVFVYPPNRAAISNRPDPAATFEPRGRAFFGAFPQRFFPANTSIDWDGQRWTTVLLPLPADPYARASLLAHESFHNIQRQLNLSASDAPNPALDTEPGRLWFRLELRALARALRSSGPDARAAASDAVLFRFTRHHLCPGSASFDDAMEIQEGLAEYTGVATALQATGEHLARPARIIETFEDNPASTRSFAYATGPALGLLLDRYAPNWRTRLPQPSIHALLAAALSLRAPADPLPQARARAALYGYPLVAAAEHQRAQAHQLVLARLKSIFLDGPTLTIPPTPSLSRSFNPNNLIPFPPHGTVYPTGAFSAEWGKLEVQSTGALLAPDNQALRLPAPADPAARPLHGDGWTLQLNPGWSLKPAATPGSFTLAR